MSEHYDYAGARVGYGTERAARFAAPAGYDASVYRCGQCGRYHYDIDKARSSPPDIISAAAPYIPLFWPAP